MDAVAVRALKVAGLAGYPGAMPSGLAAPVTGP
jgi:hypothetical protein